MTCSAVHLRSSSDSFNRPADTNDYADNDLVANSTTAGQVTPLEFSVTPGNGRGFEIIGATLQKSGAGVTGATFELYLFAQEPTTAVGDNAAFTPASFTTSGFIGVVAFPAMTAFSDDARAVKYSESLPVYLSADSTIYGLLVTAAAYTDEASEETFTATIIYKQYE